MRSPFLLVAVGLLLTITVGRAVAAPQGSSSVKNVTVVMRDPGCHWFSAGGKFTTKMVVRGPVALSNLDEAALKIVGPNGTRVDPVGKRIMLTRGAYRITMVGQAPDDNHLRLVVT